MFILVRLIFILFIIAAAIYAWKVFKDSKSVNTFCEEFEDPDNWKKTQADKYMKAIEDGKRNLEKQSEINRKASEALNTEANKIDSFLGKDKDDKDEKGGSTE